MENSKAATKLDYSKSCPEDFLKALKGSSGWTITNKFTAPAAFYLPNDKGTKFLSTAGIEGGKVRCRIGFAMF